MAYETFEVGVVAEESPPVNRWAAMTYTPVALVLGAPQTAPWTPLGDGVRGRRFFAGVAAVEMFSGETGFLRDNLLSGDPRVWIVLRKRDGEPPCELVLVTVDPTVGEAAQNNPDDIVATLSMPPDVQALVEDFVARRHVERPFYKRRRDEYEEDGGGARDGARERRR